MEEVYTAMPAARLTMKKIREILRLRFELGRTQREIAKSCNLSTSTVGGCLARCKREELSWPLPEEMSDSELERRVYRIDPCTESQRAVPDWQSVHNELRRRDCHVSLFLLWEEYHKVHPDAYEYSWFCRQYRMWDATIEPIMRKQHRGGYATFVDYAGDTVSVIQTGEVRRAQVFVAVLGASNYTFCEASWHQDLACWTQSHVRMFEFFGGVTEILVPDNLASGVKEACFFEPDLNPTYRELAKHYQVAVVPARVRKPKDKAKVETAVLIAERWIIARLRNRVFYSLDDVNVAIAELLVELNQKPFQKLPGCRESAYRELDLPKLRPLPVSPYEMVVWKKATVHLDYHVQIEGCTYSVPHKLVRESVEARLTSNIVEIFHDGHRVACHERSHIPGRTITCEEHMPAHHREVARWSPEVMRSRARRVGIAAETLAVQIMASKEHPEQGIRACLGLMKLGDKYGVELLETACKLAVERQAFQYRSVKNLLERHSKGESLTPKQAVAVIEHENIRGESYYSELASQC